MKKKSTAIIESQMISTQILKCNFAKKCTFECEKGLEYLQSFENEFLSLYSEYSWE